MMGVVDQKTSPPHAALTAFFLLTFQNVLIFLKFSNILSKTLPSENAYLLQCHFWLFWCWGPPLLVISVFQFFVPQINSLPHSSSNNHFVFTSMAEVVFLVMSKISPILLRYDIFWPI